MHQADHTGKKILDAAFQTLAAKSIDRSEIRSLTPAEPHERDVFGQLLSDFTARINVIQIPVNQDF